MNDEQEFAFATGDHEHGGQSGMTLRDYMAGQALAGMLAYSGGEGTGSFHSNSSFEGNAKYAYQQADAMMKARGK